MATRSSLRSLVYDIIGEEQDNKNYPVSFVNTMIDSVYSRVMTVGYTHPMTNEIVGASTIGSVVKTMRVNQQSTTVQTIDLGDTEIVGNTINFPSSGVVGIDGMLFSYSSKTDTQFEGVQALGDNFYTTTVTTAYLVTNISNTGKVIKVTNEYGVPQYQESEENISGYNVGKGYIFFKLEGLYNIEYISNPTIENDDSVLLIPDMFANVVIPYLVAGEMYMNRGTTDEAQRLLNSGIATLKQYYVYEGNRYVQSYSGMRYEIQRTSRPNI